MPLTIIKGDLLQKHKETLVDLGKKRLETQKQIFYIVPDHLKFQEEVSFLSHFAKNNEEVSFMKTQVLSFPRLAWFYLKNTAFYGENALSETGSPLLIAKILQENKEGLRLLKNQVNTYGFIGQLQKIFLEFQEGKVTLEALEKTIDKKAPTDEMNQKLKEIQFLYDAYLKELPRFHFRDKRLLEGLNEELQTMDFSDVTFFIYGFEHLAKEERDLVATFLQTGADVIISAPYEEENFENASFLNWMAEEVDYFTSLIEQDEIVTISLDEKITGPQKILKNMWENSFTKAFYPEENSAVANYLSLKKAPTPYEEVMAVAKEIRYLVTEKKARYQDISLFIRDYELYGDLIQYVFSQNEIPVLFSESKKMKNHPFLEFLNSLFRIEENHFQYRDVMRFLKTEYLWLNDQSRDEVVLEGNDENKKQFQASLDQFENVILANGFSGRYFSTKLKWKIVPPLMEKEDTEEISDLKKALLKKEEAINTFKDGFVGLLNSYFKKMKEKDLTSEKGVSLFYQFILNCGVKEKFAYYTKKAIDEGQLELARNYQQTWQVFCQILDEFQTIYQGLPFNYSLFKETLTTAFENLTYDQIPQTIDHIQVNTLDTIYPQENVYVFALGLNEKTLPKLVTNDTLLTDEEREFLSASFQELENQPELTFEVKNENQKENLRMYHLLMSAQNKLYLSYASQIDTKPQNLSPFVLRVKETFLLPMEEISPYQLKKEEASFSKNYLDLFKKSFTTPRQLISDYAQNQFDPEKEKLDAIWEAENIRHLLGNKKEGQIFQKMLAAWEVKNQPEELLPEEATALYGKDLHSSVSKMETFYSCQYRFFLQYGLKVRKREILELNPLVQGLLYHAVLEEFMNQLMFDRKDLGNLQLSEVETYFNRAFLQALNKEAGFKVFERTKQMGYIKNKLQKLLKNMVTVMHYQMQAGHLKPLKTELPYNHFTKSPDVLKGLDLPLSDGNRLFLKGFIDRLDYTVTDENKMYVTVIDYKSSDHNFNFDDAYEGLSMQMLTYLQVVLMNKDGILDFLNLKEVEFDPKNLGYYPGGALYLQIQNQVLEPRQKLEILQKGELSSTLLNPYRYKGLLVNETDFLQAIDPALDEKKKSSLVFPTSATNFVTEEDLDLLLKKNEKNLVEAGLTLQEGKIAINPYRKSNSDFACQSCPFRSICRFDPMTKENHYRELTKQGRQDILKKIGGEEFGHLSTN